MLVHLENNVNVFYEINLSDLSGTRAVKIVNGHKFSYGKEVTNGTVTRTCTVCGENQDNVAVPTSMEPVYTKANGHLAYLRGNIELDPGTYQWYVDHALQLPVIVSVTVR